MVTMFVFKWVSITVCWVTGKELPRVAFSALLAHPVTVIVIKRHETSHWRNLVVFYIQTKSAIKHIYFLKSLKPQASSTLSTYVGLRVILSYNQQMSPAVGLFFRENLMNSAPLISMTCTCVGYTRLHTHAVYIQTKCWQGLRGWRVGSCCLRPSCPEEKLQAERGDIVRNVYKAVSGWKAEDDRAPTAFCFLRKQETERLVTV